MKKLYVASSRYTHPDFGTVNIKVSAQARSIRARWIGPELTITIPKLLPAEDYDRFLADYHDRILELRPKARFYDGQIIDGPLVDFTITVDTLYKHDLYISFETDAPLRGKKANCTIHLHKSLFYNHTFESADIEESINDMLKRAAKMACYDYIVPLAMAISERAGLKPTHWAVSHARTKHGSCSADGTITLSSHLIFMPLELVELVVLHELAHLCHHDHSAAFHALVDKLTGGREALLNKQIKSFRSPVF